MPEWSCVKIPDTFPLRVASLLGCGVPTGWGSAVNAAQAQPGDVVIVMGVGGIGINAVQGAAHAGAGHVIAADPVQLKRDAALRLGATQRRCVDRRGRRSRPVADRTGRGPIRPSSPWASSPASTSRRPSTRSARAGRSSSPRSHRWPPSGSRSARSLLAMFQKRLQGCLYGMMAPSADVPRLLTPVRARHAQARRAGVAHLHARRDQRRLRGHARGHATSAGVIEFSVG